MSGRYTVVRANGCIVIEGAIPIGDLVGLMHGWEKDRAEDESAWIVDAVLSSHLNCNMVIGPPQACLAWRERLGIVAEGPPRPPPRFAGQAELEAELAKAPASPALRRFAGNPPYASIQCPHCHMRSYNPTDIADRYCGNCNVYLDD